MPDVENEQANRVQQDAETETEIAHPLQDSGATETVRADLKGQGDPAQTASGQARQDNTGSRNNAAVVGDAATSAATDAPAPTPIVASAPIPDPLALADSNLPVPVEGPYRRNRTRIEPGKLPRGILKPAPVAAPRFSFRRDVLSYVVGESLASTPSVSSAMSASLNSSAGGVGSSAGHSQPPGGAAASTSRSIGSDTASDHPSHPYHRGSASTPQQPSVTAPPASSGKGAFWRRLGGTLTAVAAQVPVPQAAQRTLNHLAERTQQSLSQSQNGHALPSSSSSSSQHPPATQGNADNPTSPSSSNSLDTIKSVRFTMSSLTVIYPINAPSPPGTEASTRKRVNKEYRIKKKERENRGGWTGEELTRLYDECCRTREEPGIEGLRRLLMDSSQPPKVIDLKGTQLSKGQVEVLSDVLSVEFGLKKLILEDCGLDDESLKPLIHSLLVSGTLPTLSLANNKRIRSKGWRLISLFVQKANALRYLDISDNLIDKKVAEGLVEAIASSSAQAGISIDTARRESVDGEAALGKQKSSSTAGTDAEGEDEDLPPLWAAPLLSRSATRSSHSSHSSTSPPSSSSPSSALSSLRLESCSLKNPTLETLANGIRQSDIKHISLRRNKINNLGAVALAVMIRDYELPGSDNNGSASAVNGSSNAGFVTGAAPVGTAGMNGLFPSAFSPIQEESFRPGSPSLSVSHGLSSSSSSMRAANGLPSLSVSTSSSSGNSVTARLEAAAQAAAQRPLPPVPPRRGSAVSSNSSSTEPSSAISRNTLSLVNGASHNSSTEDLEDPEQDNPFGPERNRGRQVILPEREAVRHAEMKARLKKQIDALPRVGSLLTLDVRSNEIKGGVTYIAQVLKRNRTLKVLNLSDNKIDSQGLMTIAEALKYNSTLETLDLSNNPCCGPSLEGVNTLRTAFAFNTSLLRIFLTNTDFSTSASISLAEFLPEVHSLIHLDLTDNPEIEIAGIMALAASVKLNKTLRCLDLSIPPNDPEYARLSQDILQSCIRNTELAQEQSAAKGIKPSSISQPIYKSEIATQLRELAEVGKMKMERIDSVHGDLPDSWRQVVDTARECIGILEEIVEPDEERKRQGEPVQGKEVVKMVLDQAYAAESQLAESMKQLSKGDRRDAVGALGGRLAGLLQKAGTLYGTAHGRSPSSGSFDGDSLSPTTIDTVSSSLLSPLTPIKSPASPSEQLPSPSFSIQDSDEEDSDAYSLESRTPPTSPRRARRPMSLEIPPANLSSSESTMQSSLPRSPVESHSRVMVMEEGEVFRKSTSKVGEGSNKTLLDVLDDDNDDGDDEEGGESRKKEGEELRQEILETKVEKTRRTSLTNEEVEEAQLAKEVKAKLLHDEQSAVA